MINSSNVTIKVPSLKDEKEIVKISFNRNQIVKVLVNFNKLLPVIFYYLVPSVGLQIRDQLNMTQEDDMYFDPCSKEDMHKRITLLPEIISDEMKKLLKTFYEGKIDELTSKEANDILLKTCPKEVTKVMSATTWYVFFLTFHVPILGLLYNLYFQFNIGTFF